MIWDKRIKALYLTALRRRHIYSLIMAKMRAEIRRRRK